MARRKRITARDALLRAYESTWATDALAQDYATALMVQDGWDEDIAAAAVIAAFNAHFAVAGAV